MGRRKITIKQIPDVKLRHITFNKRKNGLFKKAAELSVLCNLNLLLVCEDGLGNLIRFSKNRITDINSFISQCTYQHVIDLTSDDYPDFSKINRKKDKDRDDTESGLEDEPSIQTKEENITPVVPIESKRKPSTKTRSKPLLNLTTTPEDRTGSQRQKNKGANTVPADDIISQTSGGLDSVQRKNKNRLNLRLKIPKQEGAAENQSNITNESSIRMPSTNFEQTNMGMVSDRARKQSDSQPMRGFEKNEFASPSFMPYGDPLKRIGIYDSSTSPFKLYSQNVRMEPLSSVLKGLSPFTFPIGGTPIISRAGYGEGDMGRGGMGPETGNSATSNKVFTFQHEDSIPSMNQMSTRNDFIFGNQRHMQSAAQMQGQLHDYINLPSAMKSEPDFDMNMPPETLSARRFNFDGYFKDSEDTGYTDLRKKYKLT